MTDPATAQELARHRLRELRATFPNGGADELRGKALAEAVRLELMKLPGTERENWLGIYGRAMRIAVGKEDDAPRPTTP